jgi:predicted nucleic acid-binding Zn ribbon protein
MERAARLIKKDKRSKEILNTEDLIRALWPAAVGKAIAAHTSRLKLVRSRLVVETEDAIWQKQLFCLSAQIVARLNKVLGEQMIEDIEFRIGVPRREPMRSAANNSAAATTEPDEADGIQSPVLKKLYLLSRKKATA